MSANPTTVPAALRVAAVASLLAGLIHFAVVPEHRAEWWADAVFFTVLGGVQIIWAAAAVTDGRQVLRWAAAVVNAGTVVLWLLTRTAGLPFGPDAWEPEDVGVLDVACGLAELAVVVAVCLVARQPDRPGADSPVESTA